MIACAFCFDLASFQFQRKQHVLICLGIASILIGLHFWLLQATTAALVTFIAATRFFTATVTRAPVLMYLFILAIIGVSASTWQGLLSLLVMCSACLSTWAAFRASNRGFRQAMMVTASLMIVHNTLAGSPGGVALELFFLGSNLVAYYRFYWRAQT
jgi:hypothetical protein